MPRIVPRFRAGIPAADAHPAWLTAILAEATAVGTLITMAVVPWTYDNVAALEGILISFVVSLIVRGLMKAPIPTIVFIAVAGAAWGLVHSQSSEPCSLALVPRLVVWAVMPRAARFLTPQ